MESIFGDETIPVTSESPEEAGHDEQTAVDTESEEEEYDGGGAEQESDEEADEDEETEDAEEDGDEDPDAGNSDALLAGKYKSPAELAKAYANAQRKIAEQGRELNQLRNQQPATQTPAPMGNQQPGADRNAVFWEHFKHDPLGTMQFMMQNMAQQQVAPLIEQRQTETLGANFDAIVKQYPQMATDEGMSQLFDRVQEIANELGNPQLAQYPTARIIRLAAEEAFGPSSAKAYEQGKRAGREEQAATRRTKQAVTMPKGGKKKETAFEDLSPAEQIRANIVAAGRGGGGIFG